MLRFESFFFRFPNHDSIDSSPMRIMIVTIYHLCESWCYRFTTHANYDSIDFPEARIMIVTIFLPSKNRFESVLRFSWYIKRINVSKNKWVPLLLEDWLENVGQAVVRKVMRDGFAMRAVSDPPRDRVQWQTPFPFVPMKLRRIRPSIKVCAVYARCKTGSVRQLSLEIELITIAKESHYISKLGSNL